MASRESGVDLSFDVELSMDELDKLAEGDGDLKGFYKIRSRPLKTK